MDSFKRTLAIMQIELLRSELNQTSKEHFDEEMSEWKTLGNAGNLKKEVAKQRRLLHLLDPKLLTIQPYDLAVVHVLNRMANVVMTMGVKQAHTWACKEVGLDPGALCQKLAGSTNLANRVRNAMNAARRTLQNIS